MERDPKTYKLSEKDSPASLPGVMEKPPRDGGYSPYPHEHHEHLRMRALKEKEPEAETLDGPDSTGHYPPQVDEETLDCAPGGFQYVPPVEREDPLPEISLILSSLNIHMEVKIPSSELATLTLQFKIK